MVSSLKPCPACGGDHPRFYGDSYQCDECVLRSPFAQTVPAGCSLQSEAALHWNSLPRREEADAEIARVAAQRDRLAEACRSVMRQAGDYRDGSWTCWSPVFDRVSDALAAIDKEPTE